MTFYERCCRVVSVKFPRLWEKIIFRISAR